MATTYGAFGNIVVPNDFGQGPAQTQDFYLLPVTFRGDMYHLRAAMAVKPRPIILLEYTETAREDSQVKQLVGYLATLAHHKKQDVFLTPWNKAKLTELTSGPRIGNADAKGCQVWYANATKKEYQHLENPNEFMRKQGYLLIEFDATMIIGDNASRIAEIAPAMAEIDIPENDKEQILAKFASLEKQDAQHRIFPAAPKDEEYRVLVLHRGSDKSSGVYPEYDSGDALSQILKLIEEIGGEPQNRKLSPIICGDEQIDTYPSTGAYWDKLAPLNEGSSIPRRSFEAYYFLWAYRQNHFEMVVGFRSGALDLFTFLGIPTVSIGLRNGVGEVRHSLLAKPDPLKRFNVQYDLPRHIATAWRKSRGPPRDMRALLDCLESPYWKSSPPPGIEKARPKKEDLSGKQMTDMLSKKPQKFEDFDRRIIELGLRVACAEFLGIALTMERFNWKPYNSVITAEDMRDSIPLSGGKVPNQFVKDLQTEDRAELDLRKQRHEDLQESASVWEVYKTECEEHWKR